MNSSQQKLTLSFVLIALLASNVIAYAQASKQGAKSPTNLGLDAPANGDTSPAAPAAPIDDLQPIPDLDDRTKQLGEQQIIVTASEATRLRELERKVDRLEQLIEAQSGTLQDIADKIATPSAELKAIHEELVKLNSRQTVARPQLGDEAPSLAQLGKLVVNNYTGGAYTMTINGYQFVVPPGRGEFNVQFGDVTTQLLGYESPKTWTRNDWREVNGQQQLAIQIR
jgi:hypothetical protein